MRILLIGLFQLLTIASMLNGQSIQAEVNTDSLSTGDIFQLHIAARYDPDVYDIIFPDSMQFEGEIEYLSSRRFRGVHSRDSLVYTLQFFALQDTVLTSKIVIFVGEEGNLQVTTPEIPLYFKSLLNSEEQNLRPLKPLFNFAKSWWFLILLALFTALIALLAYYYRNRFKRKQAICVTPDPVIPKPFRDPLQELINRIVHLQTQISVNHDNFMQFYTELSEAFREYFEAVYGIPALESTTREVVRDLKIMGLNDKITGNVNQLLRDSDLVKFAKYKPEPEFVQKNYALAEFLLKAIKKNDTDRIIAMRYHHEQMWGLNAANTRSIESKFEKSKRGVI